MSVEAVVAGHICLDVIPLMESSAALAPGALVQVGPARLSTGGAVSNTGLALHRLGVRTGLMGKVGRDLFGDAVLDLLRQQDPALAEHMVVDDAAQTSYSVVISPPDRDRTFLHCPGANDTFDPADVPLDRLRGARLLHFGYPPIMRKTYVDGGHALRGLLDRVHTLGVTTSLDMSRPDPSSESGSVDWIAWLQRVLPAVDAFLPSLDEALFMTDRARLESLTRRQGDVRLGHGLSVDDLARTAEQLLAWGAAVVVLKLGEDGLYVRTTEDARRLEGAGAAFGGASVAWCGREMLAPVFEADFVGATGSGDCTIAGFLAALLRSASPEAAAEAACAVGACSVESADATSGVPSWEHVERRLQAGWPRRAVSLPNGWAEGSHGVRIGPCDARSALVAAKSL